MFWNLNKDARCLMEISDQFSPYLDLFGCSSNSLKTGRFKGTLFRLPLRRCHSELSQTIYGDDRIEKLFRCFEVDANLVPLFLKRVERITLERRGVEEKDVTVQFVVQLAQSCRDRVRKERADFLDKVMKSRELAEQQDHITASYDVFIETVEYGVVKGTFHYLVTECYACGEVSSKFHLLRQELKASYLPMVGVALLVRDPATESDDMQPDGQTFCVLPLPKEKKSSSGLPVHVNGYFSVGQNRRDLKWKTAGQQEDLDKDVAWNGSLLAEALPYCYVELIKRAIDLQGQDNHRMAIGNVYAAVPDMAHVDEKWKQIPEAMLRLLSKERWIHTTACGGRWVTQDDCLLDSSKPQELQVGEVLLSMGYNVVTPPAHTRTAIRWVNHVTPQLVRSALKKYPTFYTDLDENIKMALLKFILQDEKFIELDGISLIPLEDGTYGQFRSSQSTSEYIYIPSSATQRSLFPGLESKLVRENIEVPILGSLIKIADHGECFPLF